MVLHRPLEPAGLTGQVPYQGFHFSDYGSVNQAVARPLADIDFGSQRIVGFDCVCELGSHNGVRTYFPTRAALGMVKVLENSGPVGLAVTRQSSGPCFAASECGFVGIRAVACARYGVGYVLSGNPASNHHRCLGSRNRNCNRACGSASSAIGNRSRFPRHSVFLVRDDFTLVRVATCPISVNQALSPLGGGNARTCDF
jgi:hypothetical protein